MAARCENKNVNELKVELQKRGAKTTGCKSDLIERLEAYDRNENFQNEAIIIPRELLPNWPGDVTGFKQLSRDHRNILPKITDDHIRGYFKFRLATDREMTGDNKAMEKARLMLESNRVEACSYISLDVDIFFTAIVRAAMKKKDIFCYRDQHQEPK
ncbi:uncharacterized protein LOC141904984 [Tubulanus polymorphus]|uniref:uncharacterized protein LOC141904984 n=1 Tax=Tubulanus polymorphus TaxID=672921 RepID=UPI003DA37260